MQYRHEIGNLVKFKKGNLSGLNNKQPYKITDIRRSLDGAYDFDDVSLEGLKGTFCEFDLEPATNN